MAGGSLGFSLWREEVAITENRLFKAEVERAKDGTFTAVINGESWEGFDSRAQAEQWVLWGLMAHMRKAGHPIL